ncbi:MAG: hypothetical protein GW778_00215 [Alphaproteobacteria bacterium]|nr:hypothetical protein [Alphaproteobacteria bacterium]
MSDIEIAVVNAYTPDEDGRFTDGQLDFGLQMLLAGIDIPEAMKVQLAERHARSAEAKKGAELPAPLCE